MNRPKKARTSYTEQEVFPPHVVKKMSGLIVFLGNDPYFNFLCFIIMNLLKYWASLYRNIGWYFTCSSGDIIRDEMPCTGALPEFIN